MDSGKTFPWLRSIKGNISQGSLTLHSHVAIDKAAKTWPGCNDFPSLESLNALAHTAQPTHPTTKLCPTGRIKNSQTELPISDSPLGQTPPVTNFLFSFHSLPGQAMGAGIFLFLAVILSPWHLIVATALGGPHPLSTLLSLFSLFKHIQISGHL